MTAYALALVLIGIALVLGYRAGRADRDQARSETLTELERIWRTRSKP